MKYLVMLALLVPDVSHALTRKQVRQLHQQTADSEEDAPAPKQDLILCPNGQYVRGDYCRLCPDGTYVGHDGCALAPDGTYH